MRLLFVADPLAGLNPRKDSTVALMRAAARRGDEIWSATPPQLAADEDGARVAAARLEVFEDDAKWMTAAAARVCRGGDFDAVLMRQEPPVDDAFVMTTRFVDMLQTPAFNAPRALREWNEKLSILRFADCAPPTRVLTDADEAADFHRQHGAVVLKPLDGMGGQGVYVAPAGDLNFRSVFEMLGGGGRRHVMAQAYLPAARAGDCRVFVVGGAPLPFMLRRLPRDDDHRGNLAAGGRGEAAAITEAEAAVARRVGGELARAGILFAGLDIVGGKLIEINITCPTGLRQVREQTGDDPACAVLDALAAAV